MSVNCLVGELSLFRKKLSMVAIIYYFPGKHILQIFTTNQNFGKKRQICKKGGIPTFG